MTQHVESDGQSMNGQNRMDEEASNTTTTFPLTSTLCERSKVGLCSTMSIRRNLAPYVLLALFCGVQVMLPRNYLMVSRQTTVRHEEEEAILMHSQGAMQKLGVNAGALKVAADDDQEFDWKSHVKFFVLGVQKGGTTSLHKYMGEHPRIQASRPKETRCLLIQYDPEDPFCERYYKQDSFLEQGGPDYITGDFSPGYIYDKRVVKRIRRTYPDAQFIVSLRNPIERAFSQFKMNHRNGKVDPDDTFESYCLSELEGLREVGLLSHWTFPPTFDDSQDYSWSALEQMYLLASVNETKFATNFASPEMLEAWMRLQRTKSPTKKILWSGLYAYQLYHWFAGFPRDRFLVISLEETAVDLPGVMRRIHTHLGLEYVPVQNTSALNTAKSQSQVIMSDAMRQILIKLYRPYDDMLVSMMKDDGWTLPWTLDATTS